MSLTNNPLHQAIIDLSPLDKIDGLIKIYGVDCLGESNNTPLHTIFIINFSRYATILGINKKNVSKS